MVRERISFAEALSETREGAMLWADYLAGLISHDKYLELSRDKEKRYLYLLERMGKKKALAYKTRMETIEAEYERRMEAEEGR